MEQARKTLLGGAEKEGKSDEWHTSPKQVPNLGKWIIYILSTKTKLGGGSMLGHPASESSQHSGSTAVDPKEGAELRTSRGGWASYMFTCFFWRGAVHCCQPVLWTLDVWMGI